MEGGSLKSLNLPFDFPSRLFVFRHRLPTSGLRAMYVRYVQYHASILSVVADPRSFPPPGSPHHASRQSSSEQPVSRILKRDPRPFSPVMRDRCITKRGKDGKRVANIGVPDRIPERS